MYRDATGATSRFDIRVGGQRLEAARWAGRNPEGPTVLLLHEGLGCVALWRDFPERLAEATGRGVLAYSRRGYGHSDPCDLPRPLDYMEREASDVLPAVLDQAGLGTVILLGHSDGASIAALHAGLVRDPRVAGLVLLAPHFFVEDCSVTSIAAARLAYEAGGLRAKLARYHNDPDGAFRGWCEAWLDPGFRDWNISAHLKRIAVPVLAIQGQGDAYGTPAQLQALRQETPTPVEIALLQDCGHAPQQERTCETLDLTTRFLGTLRDAGG